MGKFCQIERWKRENLMVYFQFHVKPAGECWEWQGRKSIGGYGVFSASRRAVTTIYAHRYAFEESFGIRILPGEEINHLCRNRACVRPSHLELTTHRLNMLHGDTIVAKQAKQTHCKHGHAFSKENTFVRKNKRICKTCERVKDRLRSRRRVLRKRV